MKIPPLDLSDADLFRERLEVIDRLRGRKASSLDQRRSDQRRFLDLDLEMRWREMARNEPVPAERASKIRAQRRTAAPTLEQRVAAAKRALGIHG